MPEKTTYEDDFGDWWSQSLLGVHIFMLVVGITTCCYPLLLLLTQAYTSIQKHLRVLRYGPCSLHGSVPGYAECAFSVSCSAYCVTWVFMWQWEHHNFVAGVLYIGCWIFHYDTVLHDVPYLHSFSACIVHTTYVFCRALWFALPSWVADVCDSSLHMKLLKSAWKTVALLACYCPFGYFMWKSVLAMCQMEQVYCFGCC